MVDHDDDARGSCRHSSYQQMLLLLFWLLTIQWHYIEVIDIVPYRLMLKFHEIINILVSVFEICLDHV